MELKLNLHPVDSGIILVYMAGMAAMGFWLLRRNTSTEEYFVGGRKASALLVGLSMVGTSISTITFLSYPADSFKTNWLKLAPMLMLPVAVFVASHVFLKFYRRSKVSSAYQYLEYRFGPSVRVYGSTVFIAAQLVRISSAMYLLAELVQPLTGLDPLWAIILGTIFVGLYTVTGGIDAVMWTDAIQTVILLFGGIFCVVFILHQLPGGLEQVFSVAAENNKFAFAEVGKETDFGFTLRHRTLTMMFILGLSNFLASWSQDQNLVQRYCAARSLKSARKAMYINAAVCIPMWTFFYFLGTCLFVYFRQYPVDISQAVLNDQMLNGEVVNAEKVFPWFIVNRLPVGIVGLVISAVLAAAMSSIDSGLNAISTVSTVDIYRRHLVKGKSDRHYLFFARSVAVFASVVMIFGALGITYADTTTLQHITFRMVALFSGGIAGVYFMGFFTKRGDERSIWIAIACTVIFTASMWIFEKQLKDYFDLYYVGMIGNLVMFVVAFIAASFIPSKKRDLTDLTVYTLTAGREAEEHPVDRERYYKGEDMK